MARTYRSGLPNRPLATHHDTGQRLLGVDVAHDAFNQASWTGDVLECGTVDGKEVIGWRSLTPRNADRRAGAGPDDDLDGLDRCTLDLQRRDPLAADAG